MTETREGDWSGHPRSYWLPAFGTGNGLSAGAWAPIADLNAEAAQAMLAFCAEQGIAAFASPRGGARPRKRRSRPQVFGVWVDSEHYSTAQEVLRHTMFVVRERNRAAERDRASGDPGRRSAGGHNAASM